MKREEWQDRQKINRTKRAKIIVGYTLDQHTFDFNSVERIGPVYIIEDENKDTCLIYFKIYYKSGKSYKYSKDIPKEFKVETKENYFIFPGKITKRVPKESQYYFDHNPELINMTKKHDEIVDIWMKYIKRHIS